jgi:signal transduction histidine kinase
MGSYGVNATPSQPRRFRLDGERPERRVAASADSAKIAHEIRNPLDSLLNLLYLIETEATLTPTGHHYLSLAQEEVRRISQIAGEILNQQRARQVPRPRT